MKIKVKAACGEEENVRIQALEALGFDMAEAAAALDVIATSQQPGGEAVQAIIVDVSPKADCLNIRMGMMQWSYL